MQTSAIQLRRGFLATQMRPDQIVRLAGRSSRKFTAASFYKTRERAMMALRILSKTIQPREAKRPYA
ncbi:hypothetical protein MES4922_300150 [Mesorhizobium ventifaucium]|uniref:Uncharacterized protein n=1 Tax=Mesorhizobium ventifaucium TaxID=666020 RepID=A0ABM9E1K8_9HYPH|nr:hypothetical protein MES4922_300150 [Mesorhizobium ventifaucium]